MKNIEELIITKFPLNMKIESPMKIYKINSKRYILFLDENVEKKKIEAVLNMIIGYTKNEKFNIWKTIIVVGKTKDYFLKKDLFYFDSISTFVVFYLYNEESRQVLYNDSWIFALGCNYRKYVRKINKIIESNNFLITNT